MTISTSAAMRVAAERLRTEWQTDPRWAGVARDYSAEEVIRLRGSIQEEQTLARHGAERLWRLLHEEDYVPTLGALTGGQAVQQVRAGLKAIYVSGWQVAADANTAGHTYPDQSIYPVNSVPQLVRRINNALRRADQITWAEATEAAMSTQAPEKANAPAAGMATQVPETASAAKAAKAGMAAEAVPAESGTGPSRAPYWLAPIVADAEAGFGGVLNVFELMTAMIAAGAAGVHWEDQLASEKKCGHLGGKVLVPTGVQIRTLSAARLAADVAGVPTLVIARTDAESASLLTSDVDERDRPFLTGERTSEGYHRVRNGLDACIARALAYAPYADLLWMETPTPDLAVATAFAEAVRAQYPDQLLAYNCSPSFHWRAHLDDGAIAKFQRELGQLGYAFQFITLAGFHSLQHGMFTLAREYAESGMSAYVALQQAELAAEPLGYTATRHQREVGTGYFDLVTAAVTPSSSTLALAGSTERAQF